MFPVDSFRDTLEKLAAICLRHEMRFHLTGGITTVIYGEPRMTQHIDLVIDNEAATRQLEQLFVSLDESDFLFDVAAVRHAIETRGMFQLLDTVEALKIDMYPRELIPGELTRSQWIEIFDGLLLPVASRADAAASKLVWVHKGSHKSRRDLRQIYRTSSNADRETINKLARDLNLERLLDAVLNEPDEINGP